MLRYFSLLRRRRYWVLGYLILTALIVTLATLSLILSYTRFTGAYQFIDAIGDSLTLLWALVTQGFVYTLLVSYLRYLKAPDRHRPY